MSRSVVVIMINITPRVLSWHAPAPVSGTTHLFGAMAAWIMRPPQARTGATRGHRPAGSGQ
jgi:hypothetical protein